MAIAINEQINQEAVKTIKTGQENATRQNAYLEYWTPTCQTLI